ncbi:MAG: hypothetical protein HZC42_15035 [Candidatus Eisenbacteria bacterium]|nr:hypothetical protein [Candidatus Eisenbacteria bacterium]
MRQLRYSISTAALLALLARGAHAGDCPPCGCARVVHPIESSASLPLVAIGRLAQPASTLDRLPATDSPFGAVTGLGVAYGGRWLTAYSALLAADFRFQFADSALQARHPEGFSRADEIASAAHLFFGFVDAGGTRRAGARHIELEPGELQLGSDPAKPESTEHYRVVTAPAVRLRVTLADGMVFEPPPTSHAFHVVRGDAAALTPGQEADPDHWYMRRWVEGAGRAATPARVALPAPPKPPREDGGRPALALPILRHPNPATTPLAVELSLPARAPARLDVVDVAGRMAYRRDLRGLEPGVHRIALGGAALAPGIYWLRLTQGERVARSKVVVIR